MKKIFILIILLLLPFKVFAVSTYYVRGDADGGSDGGLDTIARAWTWAEYVAATGTIDAGDTIYIRGRNPADESTFTYTLTANFNHSAEDGTSTAMYKLFGFWDTPGDVPTESQKPNMNGASYYYFVGQYWWYKNFDFDLNNTTGHYVENYNKFENCDYTNGGGATSKCIDTNVAAAIYVRCSFENGNGVCVEPLQYSRFYGCVFKDSNVGVKQTSVWAGTLFAFCIFDTCDTAVDIGNADGVIFLHNTVYDSNTEGFDFGAELMIFAVGNIFRDCLVACSHDTANHESSYLNYNDAFNNGANYTNLTKCESDWQITTDPEFGGAAGGDFSVGENMKAKAVGFPLGTSVGYLDIGAVQREEPAGGGAAGTSAHGGFGL